MFKYSMMETWWDL